MFPSNSYMDPYFSHNKENQSQYPNFPFHPYPMSTPYHLNPNQSNNFNYPPGYYPFRPPYPHYEFPHPNFPNYYPPYFMPNPNYQFNHPQFDPAKLSSHCCGCPNHVCHQRENPNVKIEEKKPEIEERKLPNYPYPFMWFSPRNGDGNEKPKDEKESKFSWPIIWMPEDEGNGAKDQNANKKNLEGVSKPNFKIIPLKFIENGNNEEKPVLKEKKDMEEMIKKESKNEDRENNGKIVEMKKKNGKLSPVCLRVDPIPHKKSTNGSSDGSKGDVDVKSANESEDSKKKSEENKVDIKSEEKIKKEIKVVDVKTANESKDQNEKLEEKRLNDVNVQILNNNKRKMSETEVIILIQSAYRGYNVRRWDPLEKLKKIRGVYEKVQELRVKLQNVKESNKQLEKKEKLLLGETIMNLLLQLDTIQGLHPSVREARKSVARELVFLQEKLDSLVEIQIPENVANKEKQACEEPKKWVPEKQDPETQEPDNLETKKQDTEKQVDGKEEIEMPKSDSKPTIPETNAENVEKNDSEDSTPPMENGFVENNNPDLRYGVDKVSCEVEGALKTVIGFPDTENPENVEDVGEADTQVTEDTFLETKNPEKEVETQTTHNMEVAQGVTETGFPETKNPEREVETQTTHNMEVAQEVTEIGFPETKNPEREVETQTTHNMEVGQEVRETGFQETKNPDDMDETKGVEKKLAEENEKLKETLEKLLEAGRNQLGVITGLNERVKDLEKKLARKKKKNRIRVKLNKPTLASSV